MENASKALIMVGGLLISILVASFMIFILRKAGSLSAEYDTQISDNELAKFNSQFEAYVKDDNTFFDVITVANLAYDINTKNGWDEQNGVDVKIYKKNGQPMYSILVTGNISNTQNLQKNYFFEGETADQTRQKYIYGEEVLENIDTKNEDDTRLKYKFICDNEITYNEITGRVKEIKFRRDEIN